MNTQNTYQTPSTNEDISSFLKRYTGRATDVLRCGTGQQGIVRFLQHVEGYSEEDSLRLSYPLFDSARARLRRSQLPKTVIGILLLFIGLMGPIVMYFTGLGFIIISALPILAGVALLKTVIRPHELPKDENEVV
ncbi:hypothetical protein ACFSW8_05315 [Rubritalea tangerina]|uniref:DUF2335 domain-containing protein n=1 Tax=Rubritalea tangerina TaxID=430798 RepID=A0ABW4Z8J5_9BACT